MKPHTDAVMIILMLGDKPNELEIDAAFKEAGVDRNARGYLAMMGYIKSVGNVEVAYEPKLKRVYTRTIPIRVGQYEVTPKGLELLK